MQIFERNAKRITNNTQWRGKALLAAAFGMVLAPLSVQAQLLSIGRSNDGGLGVGANVGGVSVGAEVGGSSVASVDASAGSGVSAGASVGGDSGLASVSTSVGSVDADASVLGPDSVASVGVTTGSSGPDSPSTPPDGQAPGGTPPGAIPGQPFVDIGTVSIMQRLTPASQCSGAGNYDVLNGIAVLDASGTFLGVVVGAYVTGTELTRVRIAVDPGAADGGGCVEYSTAGGRATPQGIIINTTQSSLQAALAR